MQGHYQGNIEIHSLSIETLHLIPIIAGGGGGGGGGATPSLMG